MDDPSAAVGDGGDDDEGQESSDEGQESTVTSSSTTFLVPRHLLTSLAPTTSPNLARDDDDVDRSLLFRRRHPPQATITQFSRLRVSTDLNSPPSNWLYPHPDGVGQLQGFDAMPHQTGGFSSFRMAAQFLEFFRDVDVMADAEIVKKLLKMPYSKAPVSMLVHKVGHTLLIDDFDIHGFLLRSSAEEWKWLKRFFYETVFKSIEQKKKALVRRSTKKDAIQSRNLISKFLYHSLENSPAARDERRSETEEDDDGDMSERAAPGVEVAVASDGNKVIKLPPLPEPSVEAKGVPGSEQAASHEFARHLLWNFEDIRMLIGSDMPIFGDADHPAVSLRLHDKTKPINILTGLDYWLDNLMCQVPEVLMCYHIDGIVQRYELIKTEDLPNLKSCQFSPRTVRDVAKNILSFLKSNAAKEGHTYWLFKGKEDDFVKLYDLTYLCTETAKDPTKTSNATGSGAEATTAATSASGAAEESNREDDFQNPFRTAVSMLLYKVARNILQSSDREKEEGTVKKLLENCLSLLDKDKFPHIATSTHFMLSDLFIPDNVDPACPVFPDPSAQEGGYGSGSGGGESSEDDAVCKSDSTTKLIEVQALRLPHKGLIQDGASNVPPQTQPLHAGVRERCHSALSHVVEGLRFLDILVKRREEESAKEEKRKEQMERDNPRMPKPHEPIPMPYDDPTSHRQVVERKKPRSGGGRIRFNSESVVQSLKKQERQHQLSWHIHLKLVLLKKAFLVYITLSESNFAAACFGGALRCVKRALNCYKMIRVIVPDFQDKSLVLSFAFGVAGDAFMAMVRNWGSMVTYQEEYNSIAGEFDIGIAEEVEKCVDEDFRDWLIKLPQDIEESLILACKCFRQGICGAGSEHRDLVMRLGNAKNELGVFYMSQAATLTTELPPDGKMPDGLKNLFEKSMLHLKEGMDNFDSVGDQGNRALLNSNCGRIHRLYAYAYGQLEGNAGAVAEFSRQEEEHYKQAIGYYETALGLLGSRRRNPGIWDMVCWELSSALFVMGTQLQDFAPVSTEPKEDIQRQVTELLMKSLKYCDLDTRGTAKLEMYQYRAASIHYRLASMYNKELMTTSLSEEDQQQGGGGGGRSHLHMKRLAESHYAKCLQLYLVIEHHNEYLRAQLELVSLYEHCLDRAVGGNAKTKFFGSIFETFGKCVPVLTALSKGAMAKGSAGGGTVDQEGGDSSAEEDPSSAEERSVLLHLLLRRLQANLLELTRFLSAAVTSAAAGGGGGTGGKKLTSPGTGGKKGDCQWAKALYSQSLRLSGTTAEKSAPLKDICDLLERVSAETSQKLK